MIGKIRSAIERYCFINRLQCEMYETRKLFGSGRIDFRISGTNAQILQLKQDLEAWRIQLEALIE
jgi:hypothetical protein